MKTKQKKENFKSAFIFLLPHRLIKQNHLSRKDVKNIKDNGNKKISAVCLAIALVFIFLNLFLMVFLEGTEEESREGLYGILSLIGQISCIVSCGISAILSFIGVILNSENSKYNRLSIDILYIGLFSELILTFAADCTKGLVASGAGISAAITLVIFLLLIQQSYSLEATIIDGVMTTLFLADVIVCDILFDVASVYYYYLIIALYPIVRYFIRSYIFYSEVHSYCQSILNERLYNTALYDELTKCKNRFALKEYIDKNSTRWKKDSTNLFIAMFDIDDFKNYNDTFSHTAGDYCLRNIAEAIRKEFASPNLDFFRYGGEEFLLFFELENVREAFEIAERTREAVRSLNMKAPEGSAREIVTISLGGVIIQTDEDFNIKDEIGLADTYLYKAKNQGKDIVCLNGKFPPFISTQQ